MSFKVAVIGGTGVYDPYLIENTVEKEVITPFGEVSFLKGEYVNREVYFLPRHGKGHSVPPHKINYRANIWALKEEGVSRIISTAAVGSLNQEIEPGSAVLIDQFIDFTRQRPLTFFEGENDEGVVHTDFTLPYCPQLKDIILEAGADTPVKLIDYGTYVCTEGPRFETPAEIKMFKVLGGDVVGMTNVPEVVLAREIGMCYSTITYVTNYAAGISKNILSHEEVLEMMSENIEIIRKLIMSSIALIPDEKTCNCNETPGRMQVEKHRK
ncbi:MAG: S-methyl-5'-thioadenosine phosphorylase [Firmicutes bacterium HGW-Firmicutes-13]|nr:MAG: S-methyl-5'-thioadenosine phosphorylase [Firmicutes bacterium HGW-Firmicutes-13]